MGHAAIQARRASQSRSARAPRSGSGRRVSCAVMEQGKVTDVTMLVAELRERVRALDARVVELGRHL